MNRLVLVPVLAAMAAPVGAQNPTRVETRVPLPAREATQAPALAPEELRALKLEIDEIITRQRRTEALWNRERAAGRDAKRLEELEDQMAAGTWELLPKQSRLELACAEARRSSGPFIGWLGVQFDRDVEFTRESGPGGHRLFVRFEGTPKIVEVDAGSPADKAGVQPGDQWLAVNGRVTVTTIGFDELDKPGAAVAIRALRVGREIENQLVVGKRAVNYPEDVCGKPTPFDFDSPLVRSLQPGSPKPAPPRSAITMPRTAFPSMLMLSTTQIVFGGAVLRNLDADQRELLKVNEGILVAEVPLGTPGAVAGLRSLDVIVQVNGEAVRSLADFRRLAWTDAPLTWSVFRDGRTRVVKLK